MVKRFVHCLPFKLLIALLIVSSLLGGCASSSGSHPSLTSSATAAQAAPNETATAAGQGAAKQATSAQAQKSGKVAAARQAEPGSRVSWQGDTRFLMGANVPWFNWACDFGCGTHGGVSDPAVQAALAPVFAQARQAGLQTLRWWAFEGDTKPQIVRDASGAPQSLNPNVYSDIDAALALADQYDLDYDFVLFSAPTAIPKSWITDPTQRAALVSTLAPLFAHYSGNPHILSWEIFNEPENDIWNKKIEQQPVQDTVKALVDAVHANSTTYATVGSLMLDGLPMWTGMGLDYYQAHWYDYMNKGNYDALLWSYDDIKARYNLDAPLVIGEFYAGPDSKPLDRLTHFYSSDYAGAWAWSLLPTHTNDKLAVDIPAFNQFDSQQSDISTAVDFGVAIPAYTDYVPPSFTITTDTQQLQGQANSQLSVTVNVTSATATGALVDVEFYDANNKKVGQQYFDNESFTAGQSKTYTATWKPPADGTYTVMAGVFNPGWGTNYSWNANVAQITVSQ
jgi:hypothetical protein